LKQRTANPAKVLAREKCPYGKLPFENQNPAGG
jgi:hypothetical protein